MVDFPIAHWKFHQNALDCSENTYNGTETNITYVDGYSGKAAQFDGSTSKIVTTLTFDANDDTSFSVSCRFRISASAKNWHSLVDAYGGTGNLRNFQMWINSSDELVIYHCSDTGYSIKTSALSTGITYSVIYVFNSATGVGTLYLNDHLTAVDSDTIPSPNASTPSTAIHIGNRADDDASSHMNGEIDEVRWYEVAIDQYERKRIMTFYQDFDVWINNRSFPKITKLKFRPSKNLKAGTFDIQFNDMSKELQNNVTYENDIMIFVLGVLKFKGKIEQIIPSKNNNVIQLKGKDYTSILFERYAIDVSYSGQTRKYIMEDIIDTFLNSTFGPIYFTHDIDNINTATVDRTIEVETVAKILLGYVEELDAQIIIEPSLTMPLTIKFKPNNYNPTGIILDYDSPSNTTTGHKLRRHKFKKDSKQIRNIFTVYGPSSSSIAVSIRDEESINLYGEKRAKPIVDTLAKTVSQARARAEEEKTKWNTVIQTGELLCKLNTGVNIGDTILVTIDDENFNLTEFLVIEIEYMKKPKQIKIFGLALLGGSEDVISQVVKEMTTIDLRDANASSPISQIFPATLPINCAWNVTIVEETVSSEAMIVGSWTIGTSKIGNNLPAGSNTIYDQVSAIFNNEGKTRIRDVLTGIESAMNSGNSYLAVGTGSEILSVQSTGLSDEQGRVLVDTLSTPDTVTAQWVFTITNSEISDGDSMSELALFDAVLGGTMLMCFDIPTPVLKSNGNNFTVTIGMVVS